LREFAFDSYTKEIIAIKYTHKVSSSQPHDNKNPMKKLGLSNFTNPTIEATTNGLAPKL
jgi:hypothetical protein